MSSTNGRTVKQNRFARQKVKGKMCLIFEFRHNFFNKTVSAVLQQEVEKYFLPEKKGGRDIPEFEVNFQGKMFQKGIYEGELTKESPTWLLLVVARKRDQSRLRRIMREKSGEIQIVQFSDEESLKNFMLEHPELSSKWFVNE
jgi:hypothetical protein